MSSREVLLALSGVLLLSACGGGGGGGSPSPTPSPPPVSDTTPPDTSLTVTPAALANSTNANFTASATETGSVFEASLDGGAYGVVSSSFTLTVADGAHTVNVRARDAAGNTDATPASFSWTVDATPPNTHISSGPAAATSATTASFSFTSEAGATFEVNPGNGYVAATSPFQLANLADGPHVFTVRARDAAGNYDPSPDTFFWLVDTIPPDTTISASPPALTNSAVANFSFSSELGGSYQVSVDGGPYVPSGSSFATPPLGNGAHALTVRAFDLAQNMDATPASYNWMVDTAEPTANIVFPTAVSYTDATQLHVRGAAQDTSGVASVSVNGVVATSTDGFAHWTAVVPIAVGSNPIVVSVTDRAGNNAPYAAQANVANRGAVVHESEEIAFHAGSRLLYIVDYGRPAILAARPADGFVSVVSDATHGSGVALQSPVGMTLDGARALVVDGDRLIAVDLVTGDRTLLSPSPNQFTLSIFSAVAHHAASQRAFAASGNGSIIAIDLANGGTRSVFSAFSGTGANITGLALDTSTSTARLLAADYAQHSIFSVDLDNGNRTTISYASVTDPGNEIGTGPALYGPRHFAVDAANHRVLLADLANGSLTAGGLVSIDLVTGNRTLLGQTGPGPLELSSANSVALDAANGHVYVSRFHPRIVRYDISQNSVSRFVDCAVGQGGVSFGAPTGLLLSSVAGTPHLYSAQQSGGLLVLGNEIATGTRWLLSYAPNYGSGSALFGDLGNLVADPRPGSGNRALTLQFSQGPYALALRGVDLVTGDRSTLASANMSAFVRMSRMAIDMDTGRAVVGLTPTGGAGSLVGMNLGTGALTELASLSVGGGPPMYDIGAVVVLPGNYPVTTVGRFIVGTRDSLLRVNGAGDRNFINGSGPALVPVEDMVADLANRRVLIGSTSAQALQWVDLDSGDRTMVSGRTPGTQAVVGGGPAISARPLRLELDPAANLAYASIMSRTAILAVDLVSGDRVIISR